MAQRAVKASRITSSACFPAGQSPLGLLPNVVRVGVDAPDEAGAPSRVEEGGYQRGVGLGLGALINLTPFMASGHSQGFTAGSARVV